MKIPNEISDFLFEVLYSDGTPGQVKRQAHELINHHQLELNPSLTSVPIILTTSIVVAGMTVEMDFPMFGEIQKYVKNNEKIKAIKALRGWTVNHGYPNGLKECKDAVEADQWN